MSSYNYKDYNDTSCPCSFCPNSITSNKNYFIPSPSEIVPSSLSINNCQKPGDFQCTDKMYYDNDREPKIINQLNKFGSNITYLNKVGLKRANDFIEIECPESKSCPTTVYTSHDPRLLDVPRNIRMNLDVPPLDSRFEINGLKKDAIYNPKLCNYGKGYRNYEDINAGQYSYYIDSSISDPYYRPNFTIDSEVQHYVLKDPMGAFKPQYIRKPITPFIRERNENEDILKNINDSTRFREDIMEGQMRKRNEMRYESRWFNN